MSSTSTSQHADALVLFGITGDLGESKLIPALLELCGGGRLAGIPVIGVGRSQRSDQEIKEMVAAATNDHTDTALVDRLDLRYVSGDAADIDTFDQIADILNGASRPVVYAALPPAVFGDAAASHRVEHDAG